MSKIFSHIFNNKSLELIDCDSNKSYSEKFNFLFDDLIDNKTKSSAILYIDNSITSVFALLSFLNSNNAIFLLSSKLIDEFKYKLETIYQPKFIWDCTRSEIKGYKKIKTKNSFFFKQLNENETEIHDSLKILLSTSGTTGSPKFVKLSEKNILENCYSICDYLPINNYDSTPLNLPIYYSYGLSVLITNMIKGGKVICSLHDIISKGFWESFNRYGFSSLAGVPYTYEVLYKLGFTTKKYETLRYLTQAGGKLNSNLTTIFAEYSKGNNLSFFVMYGATEATARMAFLDPKYLHDKVGSIGKPIKNGKFEINNDTGELIYTGPNVFGGYSFNKTDLSIFEHFNKLNTGDIAKTDDDGFFYITGRLKRFIKLFGQRINLDEIEQYLKTKFNNHGFICIGNNDKYIIIFKIESSIQNSSINSYLKEQFNIHPSFIKINLINEIPITPNGKIDYSFLNSKYATS